VGNRQSAHHLVENKELEYEYPNGSSTKSLIDDEETKE
jgi:hypothetical protein